MCPEADALISCGGLTRPSTTWVPERAFRTEFGGQLGSGQVRDSFAPIGPYLADRLMNVQILRNLEFMAGM